MFPHKISGNSLTFFGNGRMWSVSSDHTNYEAIKEQLVASIHGNATMTMDDIIALYDERIAITSESDGAITFDGESLLINGERVLGSWATRIEQARAQKRPFKVMLKALQDVMKNENKIMRERIPQYLDMSRLGLLSDGRVTSFLVVRDDFRDVRADADYVYSIGASIREEKPPFDTQMPLLAGATGYLMGSHMRDLGLEYDFSLLPPKRKILLVAFWPSDAVGMHSLKMRVRKLEVLDEMDPSMVAEFVAKSHEIVSGYVEMEAAA